MDDPFIQLVRHRPNSTTQTPNRDIDFVLTFGINIINISTLEPNIPSYSDHIGLLFDLDINSFFPHNTQTSAKSLLDLLHLETRLLSINILSM
jgi:hypothetical protein